MAPIPIGSSTINKCGFVGGGTLPKAAIFECLTIPLFLKSLLRDDKEILVQIFYMVHVRKDVTYFLFILTITFILHKRNHLY